MGPGGEEMEGERQEFKSSEQERRAVCVECVVSFFASHRDGIGWRGSGRETK